MLWVVQGFEPGPINSGLSSLLTVLYSSVGRELASESIGPGFKSLNSAKSPDILLFILTSYGFVAFGSSLVQLPNVRLLTRRKTFINRENH